MRHYTQQAFTLGAVCDIDLPLVGAEVGDTRPNGHPLFGAASAPQRPDLNHKGGKCLIEPSS